jgi:hypothetical protein
MGKTRKRVSVYPAEQPTLTAPAPAS